MLADEYSSTKREARTAYNLQYHHNAKYFVRSVATDEVERFERATGVAANYAEASEAESPADFIHKLRLALKELKESRVWLQFGERIDPSRSVDALRQESHELMLMLSSSITTAQRRVRQGR